MKLLMIHVWNEYEIAYRGKFSSFLSYPSLTLASIYPLIPQDIFERIDIVDEISQRVNYDNETYDVVLISFDTSSAVSAYKHCDEFRKRGAYTVGGGYHATALQEEALEHFNTIIVGPAEKALPQFFKEFVAGVPKKKYEDRDICSAQFPKPAREKITRKKKLNIPATIVNRGCGNYCKYCSMRTMWKSDARPIEDVIRELKELKSKMVIFYDPNFFECREYAMELMKAMKPLKMLWVSNATADFGYDHELMQAAYDSGCRAVLLGLESLSSQSLNHAAKRFHEADKYKEIIANLHSHKIAVNGCFVLGFDGDTEEELLALPERVENLGLDLCRFAILTPYPGTRFYEEFEQEGRIITKEWSEYTQNNAVFQPRHMSPKRLEELYRKIWKECYTWKRVWKRTLQSPWGLRPYVLILLMANIGFKFVGIEKRTEQ